MKGCGECHLAGEEREGADAGLLIKQRALVQPRERGITSSLRLHLQSILTVCRSSIASTGKERKKDKAPVPKVKTKGCGTCHLAGEERECADARLLIKQRAPMPPRGERLRVARVSTCSRYSLFVVSRATNRDSNQGESERALRTKAKYA
ncbi:hypothetical protein ACLB2K_063884 [Fragaria x ananassa]